MNNLLYSKNISKPAVQLSRNQSLLELADRKIKEGLPEEDLYGVCRSASFDKSSIGRVCTWHVLLGLCLKNGSLLYRAFLQARGEHLLITEGKNLKKVIDLANYEIRNHDNSQISNPSLGPTLLEEAEFWNNLEKVLHNADSFYEKRDHNSDKEQTSRYTNGRTPIFLHESHVSIFEECKAKSFEEWKQLMREDSHTHLRFLPYFCMQSPLYPQTLSQEKQDLLRVMHHKDRVAKLIPDSFFKENPSLFSFCKRVNEESTSQSVLEKLRTKTETVSLQKLWEKKDILALDNTHWKSLYMIEPDYKKIFLNELAASITFPIRLPLFSKEDRERAFEKLCQEVSPSFYKELRNIFYQKNKEKEKEYETPSRHSFCLVSFICQEELHECIRLHLQNLYSVDINKQRYTDEKMQMILRDNLITLVKNTQVTQ